MDKNSNSCPRVGTTHDFWISRNLLWLIISQSRMWSFVFSGEREREREIFRWWEDYLDMMQMSQLVCVWRLLLLQRLPNTHCPWPTEERWRNKKIRFATMTNEWRVKINSQFCALELSLSTCRRSKWIIVNLMYGCRFPYTGPLHICNEFETRIDSQTKMVRYSKL